MYTLIGSKGKFKESSYFDSYFYVFCMSSVIASDNTVDMNMQHFPHISASTGDQ